MKRYLMILATLLLALLLIFGGILSLSTRHPTLHADAHVPDDIASQSYTFFPVSRSGDGVYRLHLMQDAPHTPLTLVLSAMRPFSMRINGEMAYTYTAQSRYTRLHTIPLPQETDLHIEIVPQGNQRWLKALLTTPQSCAGRIQLATVFSCISIGIHAAMLFCSLTLFLRKRSERDLLAQCAMVFITLTSTVLTAGLSLPVTEGMYVNIQYVMDAVRDLMMHTAVLLMIPLAPPDDALPYTRRRWYGVLRAAKRHIMPLIVLMSLSSLMLDLLNLRALMDFGSSLVWVALLMLLALSMHQRQPGMRLLGFAYLIRLALHLYARNANRGFIPDSELLIYFYAPQFSVLVLMLACMYLVNSRFADKFTQADRLVLELERANAVLDARVEERTAELVRQQQQRHSMMTNIFHDLRSPLFAARGVADIMRPETQDNAECLQLIKEKLDFLSLLSEQLFLTAKLEDRQITFASEDISLHALCCHLADSFALEAQARGVRFHFDVQAEPHITGDGFRLKQALNNLLGNALQFTPAGGDITLTLYEEGDEARICVRDTGKGIAQEDLPHVFERYYHGKNSDKQRSTGLGLSIAHEIALAHSGQIDVQSRQDEGTRFILRLPKAQEDLTTP